MADRDQPPPPVAPAPPLVPASSNPTAAPTHSAAAPAHNPDPTPIFSRLEEAITSRLSSQFGNQDQEQCRHVIGQIRDALSAKQKMFPELDALFHQGHHPQNAEKRLQLMSSILDPTELQVLLQILQNDPGSPPSEDVPQGGQSSTHQQPRRQRAQRQGLFAQQQNVGLVPATVGPLQATSSSSPLDPHHSPSSSSPPLDAHYSPEPIVNNEIEQVVACPTQQTPPPVINPIPPPVANPIPPPVANPIQPPVANPIPPPVINPIQPPVANPIQPPVINQQLGANDHAYAGFGIHRLTPQGFNKYIMRFKAIKDLTLREYICILRNRESFDIRVAPMPELREGVVLYQVDPLLNQGRVVDSGGADLLQWNPQRNFSRQVQQQFQQQLQQETICYTKYQCIDDTSWIKKVYRIGSVPEWVVVHYQLTGDAPTIDSMVRCVTRLQQSFNQFAQEDNNICDQMVEALEHA